VATDLDGDRAVADARQPDRGNRTLSGERQYGSYQLMIDLDFVRGLIAAVDQSGIDSLEITRAGTRIRIAKTPPPAAAVAGSVPAAQPVVATVPVEPAPAAPAAPAAPPAPAAPKAEEATPGPEIVEVRSPMVGTFYRAPAPEAPPYVEVGSRVTRGQTLCILEAMKLMNELESEVDGIVREILVENAEPVEYGQVLFRIEPTRDSP
jgi:acetyl-CoA carboxylase biotin carboxyl carrier protein